MDNKNGLVIWFTGLSGAGKSTLAKELYRKFKRSKLPTVWLDGDDFRINFNYDLGYSNQDRTKNIERTVYVAKMLVKNGVNVIGSFITPYEKQRKFIRKNFKRGYIEIFVDAPIKVCRGRDVKSHYKKASLKKIKNFTGISDKYENPNNCEIHLLTHKNNIGECIGEVMDYLVKNNRFK